MDMTLEDTEQAKLDKVNFKSHASIFEENQDLIKISQRIRAETRKLIEKSRLQSAQLKSFSAFGKSSDS